MASEEDTEVWSTSKDRGAYIARLSWIRRGEAWELVVHDPYGSAEILLTRKDMKDLYEVIESERYGGPTLPTPAKQEGIRIQ